MPVSLVRQHVDLPAVALGEARVHAEQIRRRRAPLRRRPCRRGFRARRCDRRSDPCGIEQDADLLLERRESRLEAADLLGGQRSASRDRPTAASSRASRQLALDALRTRGSDRPAAGARRAPWNACDRSADRPARPDRSRAAVSSSYRAATDFSFSRTCGVMRASHRVTPPETGGRKATSSPSRNGARIRAKSALTAHETAPANGASAGCRPRPARARRRRPSRPPAPRQSALGCGRPARAAGRRAARLRACALQRRLPRRARRPDRPRRLRPRPRRPRRTRASRSARSA